MRQYTATFRLWDVTKGERTGELIDEDGPHRVSPLSEINAHWATWIAQSPVELGPLSDKAIRVSLSRNAGESVTRRRFEHEGSKYLITVHVSPVPETYKALINTLSGILPVKIQVIGGVVMCSLNGEPFVEMECTEDT